MKQSLGFVGDLRGASDEQRESIWSKRNSHDSKMLWAIPCPERWELLPPSERKMRSRCCAATCFLAEILLWDRSISQGPIAALRVCGQCLRPTSPLKVLRNVPEFTSSIHQDILANLEDALAVGVRVEQDKSWTVGANPRIKSLHGLAGHVQKDIERSSNANQPDAPEFDQQK